MARIGTFSKTVDRKVSNADEGDVVLKWENDAGWVVSVLYMVDQDHYSQSADKIVRTKEYWVSVEHPEGCGSGGPELVLPGDAPRITGNNGSKRAAKRQATELMRYIADNGVNVDCRQVQV